MATAAEHVYVTPGTYTATLTVTAAGKTSTDTAVVTVKPVAVEPGLVVTVTGDGAPVPADLVIIDGAGRRSPPSPTTAARAACKAGVGVRVLEVDGRVRRRDLAGRALPVAERRPCT